MNNEISAKEWWRKFIMTLAELGSILFYIGVILSVLHNKEWGVIVIALMGMFCSLYLLIKR